MNIKKLDPKWLPYFGAIVQAGLFALAGDVYFEQSFGWLVGLGVGAVVNASLAVASSRISDIAKNRKPLAYVALIGLLCLSPMIITSTLGFSVATLSWSLAADLSILLTGAIVGKSLTENNPVANNLPKVASKKPQVALKVARKHVKDGELLAYLQANPGASQKTVADHFGISRQAVGPRVKKLYAVKQPLEAEVK